VATHAGSYMRNLIADGLRQSGLTGRLKMRPGKTLSLELPPISGYGPLPDSCWVLLVLAIVAVLASAVAMFS
jgi:hypothetical protein